MNPSSPHLTSLDWDAFDLGALAPDDADTLRAHLHGCSACRQQQENRRALAEQFAREVLPRSLPVIRERLSVPSRRRNAWWWLALSPAVCGVILALVLARGPHGGKSVAWPSADPSGIAVKGEGGLLTYVRHGDKVSRLVPGSVLQAGDALRFAIDPRGNAYLMIAGVDGAGGVSAYYPFGQWRSMPVASQGRFEVPGSIVLDASAGPERIFALLSPRPVDGNLVRTQLESLARRGPRVIRSSLDLQVPGAEISSVVFEKRERSP